ncbi:MAG: CvpA family protein [Bacteroidales bacterium]|nr:CvpA family protein [Bacteroidales bacterium]
MAILDIILIIPLGWLVFLGWKKGVIREAATLAGIVAGIWAAVHLSKLVASLLGLTGESAILIAFFITFVGALVLTYLLGRGIEKMVKSAHLSLANKLAGAVLGMAKALCVIAVVLNGIVLLDQKEELITPETREKSLLYKPVYNTGNLLISSLKDFIAEHKEVVERGKEAMK